MRRTALPGLALAALTLAAGCLDPIPPDTLRHDTGVMTGEVRRGCGALAPLAGADVAVDGVVRARTDANGAYRIERLPTGTHRAAADLAGYVHFESTAVIVAGQTTEQNFALTRPGDENQAALLDVLFVIDNSTAMAAAQQALVAAFPAFAARIDQSEIPLNLHLGIVTADVGAGPYTPPSCPTIGGDRGALQFAPVGATCEDAGIWTSDHYLGLVVEQDGSRHPNFDGTLADAFACYAPVGTDGCGFEQPLEAMRRALDRRADDYANRDFLRDYAALLVVILTDEDDCSAPSDTGLFDPYPDPVLGPLTSYRCFELGSLCDGAPPGRAVGPRVGCVPGAPDPDPRRQLTGIDAYLDFLEQLKPVPDRLRLAVIAAPPVPVAVGVDLAGYPGLQASCTGDDRSGKPALRLAALTAAMPQTNFASVCADYRSALAAWADQALDAARSARECAE